MNALILMTRVPVPYKTKTRLMNIFTGEQCADIHRCFLLDLFRVCNKLKHSIDIYLTYTPEGDLHLFKDIIPDYIKIFPQEGKDLGAKMNNAINSLLHKNYEKVILIGTDIPEIQPEYIEKAFTILDKKDLCFGPTMDGGYYLVGMKCPHEGIFCEDIHWGNKSVMEGTMEKANKKGFTVGLAHKCRDIDTKEDIKEFINHIRMKDVHYKVFPINTIAFITEYWSDRNVEKNIRGQYI